MKKNLFLLIIVLGALISSCSHIDAFPPALVSYFPYSENQQIIFANESGDTTTLTVSEFFVSEGGRCPFGQKCLPPNELTVKMSNDSLMIFAIMEVIHQNLSIGLFIGELSYHETFTGDAYSPQMLEQLGDTIRFTNDGHEAIVVRYKGLVKFDDAQHDYVWNLVK